MIPAFHLWTLLHLSKKISHLYATAVVIFLVFVVFPKFHKKTKDIALVDQYFYSLGALVDAQPAVLKPLFLGNTADIY